MTIKETINKAEDLRRKAVSFILSEAYFIVSSTRIRRGTPKIRARLAETWSRRYSGIIESWAFVESFEVLRFKKLV